MLVKVRVFPSSKREEVVRKEKDSFDIRVKEKPIRGEANRAVVNSLARFLTIPESKIRLVRGVKKKNKIFEILD